MTQYRWSDGMAFLPDLAGGRCLPQVFCQPLYEAAKGGESAVLFTDDVIYRPSGSTSFLRLLVLVDDLREAEEARSELVTLDVEGSSSGEIKVDEACYLVTSPSPATQKPHASLEIPEQRLYRIATADEFSASALCKNRPHPVGYDMYRIKTELRGRRYLLVRPDRFVFAACRTGKELVNACERIPGALFGSIEGRTTAGSKL